MENNNIEEPLFEHDCSECKFLGIKEEHDLYYCSSAHTVIARFSSHGPDYMSGMIFAKEGEGGTPLLYEAKKRAISKQYMEDGDK